MGRRFTGPSPEAISFMANMLETPPEIDPISEVRSTRRDPELHLGGEDLREAEQGRVRVAGRQCQGCIFP